MKDLKAKLTQDPKGVESSILYYISIPTEDATQRLFRYTGNKVAAGI